MLKTALKILQCQILGHRYQVQNWIIEGNLIYRCERCGKHDQSY